MRESGSPKCQDLSELLGSILCAIPPIFTRIYT